MWSCTIASRGFFSGLLVISLCGGTREFDLARGNAARSKRPGGQGPISRTLAGFRASDPWDMDAVGDLLFGGSGSVFCCLGWTIPMTFTVGDHVGFVGFRHAFAQQLFLAGMHLLA